MLIIDPPAIAGGTDLVQAGSLIFKYHALHRDGNLKNGDDPFPCHPATHPPRVCL